MRLFILGASGKTGTQLIDLALARGQEVTAFVRSPAKITRRHPLLQVQGGDPHRVDELASALPGHDAVLSALGVRLPHFFRPHTLVQECAASTVAAMTRTGVRRRRGQRGRVHRGHIPSRPARRRATRAQRAAGVGLL